MKEFDNCDLTEGFVLSQGASLRYLKYLVEQEFEQAIQKGAYGIDSESAGAFFEVVVVMAQIIVDKDWEWIKFSESPMSASGIMIKEMIEKEE